MSCLRFGVRCMTEEKAYISIERYVKSENVSGMALLLDGDWGSGKSYYVDTYVKERLKNDGIKCVKVSLYGITEISQIGVQIYTQLRSIRVFKNEAALTASIVASHVLGSLMAKHGMSLTGISDDEYNELLNSMDLKNTLLVFDDVERCKIDIIEVLAYVNNLCEQGKTKVLVVANEKALLHFLKEGKPYYLSHKTKAEIAKEKTRESMKRKPKEYELTSSTKEYLLMKEKTVGDTILFLPDYTHIIKHIISNHVVFSDMGPVYEIDLIANYVNSVMDALNIRNMRSLEYACDKIDNLMDDGILTKDNSEFYFNVIFSTMCFILLNRISGHSEWAPSDRNDRISNSACREEFPLPLFIYEYLIEDDIKSVDKAFEEAFNQACDSCKSEICKSRFWKKEVKT